MLTEAYDADYVEKCIIGWHGRFQEGQADKKDDKGTYFQHLTRQIRMWKSVKTGSYEGRGIKCVHIEAGRHILTEDFWNDKRLNKFDDKRQQQQQQQLDVCSNHYQELVKGNNFCK